MRRGIRLGAAITVTLVVSCSGAASRNESAKPRTITRVHRENAGEPDANGWTTAVSTNGGFSVRLPAKFSDVTLDCADREHPCDKAFTIYAKTPNGTQISIRRLEFNAASEAAKFHERIERGEVGHVQTETPPKRFYFRAYRAVDVAGTTERTVFQWRSIVVGDRDVILLWISAPIDLARKTYPLAAEAFDSLLISRE